MKTRNKPINFANMRMKVYYLFVYYLLSGGFLLFGQSQPAALKTFLRSETVQHASISFEMTDLSTGKTVAAHNENTSLVPASIMKLVTTATALETLGGHFTYQTNLFYDGTIENSVLKGNLYIEGSGDPSLGSEFINKEKEDFLKNWLTAVRQAGIQRISGDIVVLDQLFGYEGISPKWLWEDLGNYYAPGSYGISVFDNMYRVYLRSYAPGSETKIVYTDPEMNDLQFTNTIVASASGADESYISGIPFANERRLYGHIPANRSAFAARGDLPDPGLFLAKYFTAYLQKNGIEIAGEATTYRLKPENPSTRRELSVTYSPDLASIVRVINVRSNNHYAEHLYKLLTIKHNVDVPAYWKAKGLDTTALFMNDGSGLSPADAVSADFLVSLLKYMDKKEGKGDFYHSLPVAGKEGTVASFLQGTALEGKARVKSGSMTNVQSYAGYIEKNGRWYAFAIIVNHFTGKRKDLKREIEKLVGGMCAETRHAASLQYASACSNYSIREK
jgi:D-alanyl-D-alanine carboxypeptidase/D-alanyl-D-alanine-endopeptidase (penicillin-binding protein 4)